MERDHMKACLEMEKYGKTYFVATPGFIQESRISFRMSPKDHIFIS